MDNVYFQLDWNFFLNLLIPTLTALVVCIITIFFTNRQHKKSLDQQDKQHEEILKLSKQQYIEEQRRNEERERLNFFPYLTLVPKIKKNRFSGGMIKSEDDNFFRLPFELVNEGMGAAFSISIVSLDEDKINEAYSNKIKVPCTVSIQKFCDDSVEVLGVSAPISTNILTVKNKTEFELCWCEYTDKLEKISNKAVSEWKLKIRFKDFQERYYEQQYTFITSASFQEIHRLECNKPQLIE